MLVIFLGSLDFCGGEQGATCHNRNKVFKTYFSVILNAVKDLKSMKIIDLSLHSE